jgi:DNA-binding NarL/FixJ family response regulator
MMCEGLRRLFDSQPDVKVLDGEETGKNVSQLAHELQPDVIVIDVNMCDTDNIELSKQTLSENPSIRIVTLCAQLHMHTLEEAVKAGISGFVLKECDFDELVRAVRTVYEKKTYMCSRIKQTLVNGYLGQMQADDRPESSSLTNREYEIIRLLSFGMTSKETALRMDISTKTVDAHRRKIMHKLRINSMAELVKHAIRAGITSL